jgi:UDPglucose--hexose-1-phosphate uridylyltransferase
MTPPQTLVLPEHGNWQVRVVPNLYPALERQEVVVHSPRHLRSVAELSDEELELVAEAWQRRARDEPGHLFALINEGREAGASLPHTHSQLAWLPDPQPPRGRPRAEEVVVERGAVAAASPWAGRVPYELVIGPVEPDDDPFTSELLGPALALLAEMARRLHRVEGPAPLNAWVERGPDDWRLVLFPRLTIQAGLELGAGLYVNTLPPEDAAARLRDA